MEIIEGIYDYFKHDKLYAYLERQGFGEKQLYPEFLDYINPEKMYSTIEVAEMLYVSDNDLRYYMKIMRAIGYIKSFKAGRNYRFNYLQVFQMYLVVSILNLRHHTTSDIKNILMESMPSPLNPEIENKIPSAAIEENGLTSVFIHQTRLVNCDKEILSMHYEIAVIEQKLNAMWRAFLQLDSKINLALIEKKYTDQLKEALRQVKTGWFSRNNYEEGKLTINEATVDLMDMKEQLTAMQTNISAYEKELTLKMHELKQLVDEKMKLLNI